MSNRDGGLRSLRRLNYDTPSSGDSFRHPNPDFDIATQRGEKRHQPLGRESVQLVVFERPHLGLIEGQERRRAGLAQAISFRSISFDYITDW